MKESFTSSAPNKTTHTHTHPHTPPLKIDTGGQHNQHIEAVMIKSVATIVTNVYILAGRPSFTDCASEIKRNKQTATTYELFKLAQSRISL